MNPGRGLRCVIACLALQTSAFAEVPLNPDYEEAFLDLREAGDRVRMAEARGEDARELRAEEANAFAAFRARDATGVPIRSAEAIAAALADIAPQPESGSTPGVSDCTPAAFTETDRHALQRHLYACYGQAADALTFEGAATNRLAILQLLASTADPSRRRQLFAALEPLFRSVTGESGGPDPFRRLQPMVAAAWNSGDSPVARNMAALELPPGQLEGWLVSILEAWRTLTPARVIEPWDYEYEGSPVERLLGSRARREDFERINAGYFASLGADPAALNIHYDLAPRPGKTAVAFTDFGARPRLRDDGSWSTGEPWVFASYTRGGIGNLNELVHETGHAVHIAAIRTAPAFADWPDSDAFTEAIAEIFALEVFEAEWQQRWLGAAAPLDANLRNRYSAVMLDVAWGLLELRIYADPSLDPSLEWTRITEQYLHVRPHPELAWWARRGQLVDSPGYMVNYALSAILTADIRARARAERGSLARDDPGYYAWLSERLLRFGREKSSAQALRDFLGRAPDPRALLADMRRR